MSGSFGRGRGGGGGWRGRRGSSAGYRKISTGSGSSSSTEFSTNIDYSSVKLIARDEADQDDKAGIYNFRESPGTVWSGWLLNMQPTVEEHGSRDVRAAIAYYFLHPDGSTFKVVKSYEAYFYLEVTAGREAEVEAQLRKSFGSLVSSIASCDRLDLSVPNHISGVRRRYLRVSFQTVQALIKVKGYLLPAIEANRRRKNLTGMYTADLREAAAGGDSESSSGLELLAHVLDIREYDVPYYMRQAIDHGIRVGLWYLVRAIDGGVQIERDESRLERPSPRVLAYDIETTKMPLRFPDANQDEVMMISYMIDGRGYLITNREIIGADIESFEYTPKKEYPGPFTVWNERNEEALLRRFLAHIRETQPHVFVTFNGDSFDWPFVDERCKRCGISLSREVGIRHAVAAGEYVGRAVSHLDAYRWVVRDSYLPHGSHGLKAVTKSKLGYDPLELDPEEMVPMARLNPQRLANYSVSDAVATYYLYMIFVHPFIYSLCNIIPMNPDDVLRKGSGTLCESLLMTEAFVAGIIFPNKSKSDPWKTYNGHLLEEETYTGGHVECLQSGVFRTDLPLNFDLDHGLLCTLRDHVDDVLEQAIREGGLVSRSEVVNYEEIRAQLCESLDALAGTPKRSELPVIYHLDVGAMYPNIILTNRLQPTAIVSDDWCAMCDFNIPGKLCQRRMNWVWRGDFIPASRRETDLIRGKLEQEYFDSSGRLVPTTGGAAAARTIAAGGAQTGGASAAIMERVRAYADTEEDATSFPADRSQRSASSDPTSASQSRMRFDDLSEDKRLELLKKRLKDYSFTVYRKRHIELEEERESIVCMREHAFYVDTVRAFRDRRYEYKDLLKKWNAKASEARASGQSLAIAEAQNMQVLYESLQLAHKCVSGETLIGLSCGLARRIDRLAAGCGSLAHVSTVANVRHHSEETVCSPAYPTIPLPFTSSVPVAELASSIPLEKHVQHVASRGLSEKTTNPGISGIENIALGVGETGDPRDTAAVFFSTGLKPICSIQLEDGRMLRLTRDHKVLVREGSGNAGGHLHYTDAGSLQPGIHSVVCSTLSHVADDLAEGNPAWQYDSTGMLSRGRRRVLKLFGQNTRCIWDHAFASLSSLSWKTHRDEMQALARLQAWTKWNGRRGNRVHGAEETVGSHPRLILHLRGYQDVTVALEDVRMLAPNTSIPASSYPVYRRSDRGLESDRIDSDISYWVLLLSPEVSAMLLLLGTRLSTVSRAGIYTPFYLWDDSAPLSLKREYIASLIGQSGKIGRYTLDANARCPLWDGKVLRELVNERGAWSQSIKSIFGFSELMGRISGGKIGATVRVQYVARAPLLKGAFLAAATEHELQLKFKRIGLQLAESEVLLDVSLCISQHELVFFTEMIGVRYCVRKARHLGFLHSWSGHIQLHGFVHPLAYAAQVCGRDFEGALTRHYFAPPSLMFIGVQSVSSLVDDDLTEVFDASVPKTYNFIANGMAVSNCILNSFYGYVMRRGARWYSMEMAGIVTRTGARIIMESNKILAGLGVPLELDTDGVWCCLPASFPQNYPLMSRSGRKFVFSYPCAMLNRMVHDNFTNPQYHNVDPKDPGNITVHKECSIFFEVDGPYRAMFLPSSREEDKKLKKRYAVYNKDGRLAELKGFEIKRRGELKLIKIFQGQVFEHFLDGSSLAEAYAAVAKVANRWLDVLQSAGRMLPDEELIELISESKNMSRSMEEYGLQKSAAITTAKRLSEFLGDDRTKTKGLSLKYIVLAKPSGAQVTERTVPVLVFHAQPRDRIEFLRRWCKEPSLLEDTDVRDLIDWSYYTERISGAIQKIITIPAALQGVENPVPRVAHPPWLDRRLRAAKAVSAGVAQREIRSFFSSLGTAGASSSRLLLSARGRQSMDIEDTASTLASSTALPTVEANPVDDGKEDINGSVIAKRSSNGFGGGGADNDDDGDLYNGNIEGQVDNGGINNATSSGIEQAPNEGFSRQLWLRKKKGEWREQRLHRKRLREGGSSHGLPPLSLRDGSEQRASGGEVGALAHAAAAAGDLRGMLGAQFIAVLRSPWEIIEVRPLASDPGTFRVWAWIEGRLFALQINVPRVLYVNFMSPDVASEGYGSVCTVERLPHDRTVRHLVRVELMERVYQEKEQILWTSFSDPEQVEGVYESQVPLLFRLMMYTGCSCRVRAAIAQKRFDSRDFSSHFSLEDLEPVSPPMATTSLTADNALPQYQYLDFLRGIDQPAASVEDTAVTQPPLVFFYTSRGTSMRGVAALVTVTPGRGSADGLLFICRSAGSASTGVLTSLPAQFARIVSLKLGLDHLEIPAPVTSERYADLLGEVQQHLKKLHQRSAARPLLVLMSAVAQKELSKVVSSLADYPVIAVPANDADNLYKAFKWEVPAVQTAALRLSSAAGWLKQFRSVAGFLRIPLGNIGKLDWRILGLDLAFARALKMHNVLLWATTLPKPDLGSAQTEYRITSTSGVLDTALERAAAGMSVRLVPGCYDSYCVEIELRGLAVNAVMEVDRINELEGLACRADEWAESAAVQDSSAEQARSALQSALQWNLADEDSSSLTPAFRVLREMLGSWAAGIGKNRLCEVALGNFFGWITSKSSLFHDPSLAQFIHILMAKLFMRVLAEMERLSALVIYADFTRIVVCTRKTGLVARTFADYLVEAIMRKPEYQWLDLTVTRRWDTLVFMDQANYGGVLARDSVENYVGANDTRGLGGVHPTGQGGTSSAQNIEQQFDSRQLLDSLETDALNLTENSTGLDDEAAAVEAAHASDITEIPPQQTGSNPPRLDGTDEEQILAHWDLALHLPRSLQGLFLRRVSYFVRLLHVEKPVHSYLKSRLAATAAGTAPEFDTTAGHLRTLFPEESPLANLATGSTGSSTSAPPVPGAHPSRLLPGRLVQSLLSQLSQMLRLEGTLVSADEAAALPESVRQHPALEYVKYLLEVFALEPVIEDESRKLRRSMLQLLQVREFGAQSKFESPSHSLLVHNVVCSYCSMNQTIDLLRDTVLLAGAAPGSPWPCRACGHALSKRRVELELVDRLQERLLAYQIQDIACHRCKWVSTELLSRTCARCNGELRPRDSAADIEQLLNLSKQAAQIYSFSDLYQICDQLSRY